MKVCPQVTSITKHILKVPHAKNYSRIWSAKDYSPHINDKFLIIIKTAFSLHLQWFLFILSPFQALQKGVKSVHVSRRNNFCPAQIMNVTAFLQKHSNFCNKEDDFYMQATGIVIEKDLNTHKRPTYLNHFSTSHNNHPGQHIIRTTNQIKMYTVPKMQLQ